MGEKRQAELNELRRRAMILLKGADGIEPRDPIRGLRLSFVFGITRRLAPTNLGPSSSRVHKTHRAWCAKWPGISSQIACVSLTRLSALRKAFTPTHQSPFVTENFSTMSFPY